MADRFGSFTKRTQQSLSSQSQSALSPLESQSALSPLAPLSLCSITRGVHGAKHAASSSNSCFSRAPFLLSGPHALTHDFVPS